MLQSILVICLMVTYTGCFMIYFTIIINMRFSDLSIQEKAAVIKLGIGSGLRSL